MIPYLPQGTDVVEVPKFYKQILDNLVIRSSHHEAWHTHKRDTSVCWICDLLELTNLVIGEMERYISKSLLDIDEQFLESEVISDEGVNYNSNEESKDDNRSDNSGGT